MAGEFDRNVHEDESSSDEEDPIVTEEHEASSDEEDPKLMEEYFEMIRETEGFDIDGEKFKNLHGYGMIGAVMVMGEGTKKVILRLSSHALKKHNEENGTELEFVKLIKANIQVGGWCRFFITFEAKDAKEDDPKVYQLRVSEGLSEDEIEIEVFRLKPSSPAPPPPPPPSSSSS